MFEILIFFVFSVIIGLMFVFFGYPFFRILLPIWAFFAGLVFGLRGLEDLLGAGVISITFGLVIGLVFGAILATIAYYIYNLAIYLFGISAGYVLGSGFMLAIGAGSFISTMVGLGVAVLFLVVFAATQMPRFFIILITAAAGAMGVIMGLLVLFGRVPEVFASLQLTSYIVANSWFWLIIWIVLAALGVAFQYVLVTVFQQVEVGQTYNWKKEYKKMK
ncbi:MAG TPA: DUF4203 domain-containing protein [Patescibacteria group bacterium]|nr:DUF4203 domain-containing protein [Patescibacteria group bacterium]